MSRAGVMTRSQAELLARRLVADGWLTRVEPVNRGRYNVVITGPDRPVIWRPELADALTRPTTQGA